MLSSVNAVVCQTKSTVSNTVSHLPYKTTKLLFELVRTQETSHEMKSRMKKCQGGSELFKDLSVIKKYNNKKREGRERERAVKLGKKKAEKKRQEKNIVLKNMCKHSNWH